MDVIPIWIADRNSVGFSVILRATAADFLPCAAMLESFDLLEVSSATSDIANIAFVRIRTSRRRISTSHFLHLEVDLLN
jgi:hypothetical protein